METVSNNITDQLNNVVWDQIDCSLIETSNEVIKDSIDIRVQTKLPRAEQVDSDDTSLHQNPLLQQNLGLVGYATRHYKRRPNYPELFNEGVIALDRALQYHNPNKVTQRATLGTYAVKVINNAIRLAAANHSRVVDLPPYILAKSAIALNEQLRLAQILERWPTNEEVAVALNQLREVNEKYADLFRIPLTASNTAELLGYLTHPLSLQSPISSVEGSSTVVEVIADKGVKTPEEMAEKNELARLLIKALDGLTYRQRQVILLINDGWKQQEIADHLKVTRAAINDAKKEALLKLRASSYAQSLKEHYLAS